MPETPAKSKFCFGHFFPLRFSYNSVPPIASSSPRSSAVLKGLWV